MRFCGDCGSSVSPDLAFCTTCGEPVGAPPDSPDPAESTVARPVSPTAPSGPTAPAPPTGDLPPTYFLSEAPPGAGPSAATQPKGPSWWSRRKAVLIGRVCLSVALVGAGMVVGWAAGADRNLVEIEPGPPVASDSAAPEVAPDQVAMPDLRGLGEADARQILADSGIAPVDVTATKQPAAGETGLVLAQDPVYGYPIDGPVALNVSAPATVPEFDGRTATDVLDDLDQLGAEVETVTKYSPGVAAGEVTAIDPAPGTELPVAVTVTIAGEADTVNIADLAFEDYTCSTDQGKMEGQLFNNLVVCSAGKRPERQTWLIDQAGDTLSGTVGVPDDQPPRTSMRLEIYGDGELLRDLTASYGERVRFSVPVSGVLRLTLQFRTLTGGEYDYGEVGIGAFELSGDASKLAKLDTGY